MVALNEGHLESGGRLLDDWQVLAVVLHYLQRCEVLVRVAEVHVTSSGGVRQDADDIHAESVCCRQAAAQCADIQAVD